jgi:predicted PurR-regulated permease PerM
VLLVALILLALIVPAISLGANLVESAPDLAEDFVVDEIAVPPPPESVAEWPVVGHYLYEGWLTASRNLESVLVKAAPYMKDVGLWLVETMGDLGWGLIMFIVAIVIAGALLPVKDRGVAITRKVASIIAGEQGPRIVDLVASSVQSVIKGVIGVAVIQAVLAGLGMLVAGVPAAGLWALLILILAVMQLPAMLVLLPVILYVFATSSTTTAVLFAIWALLVGMSDNVLKPLLMGRGSQTPMLVLFMGSLGGFMAGGILGLFVGAVVLSIGYTVFMAWLEESNVSAEGEPES